jgi:glyoxylase-like metal-dependent hydrolase (beta-lactamase superfamily II)
MHIQLGDIRVDVVSDGTFALDGGAMFGVVPKALWSKRTTPDEANRIPLALNCLLIRVGREVVLVDTGMGRHWTDKERAIYALDNPRGLVAELVDLGVTPDDVTTVINTHLHFDHCGGNTNPDGSPGFPNARYIVQRGELEWAQAPTLRDRASYVPATFKPILERFELVDGEADILPGVRVRPVPGHTPNIQAIFVEGGGDTLVFPSDLCPTVAHVPYPWIMAYDLEPLVTLETRMQLFPEIIENGWTVVFQHEPRTPVGTLREEAGKVAFDPRP